MFKPFALVLILLTAGCAEAQGKYPSLALRPIESRSDAEVDTPPAPLVADPALDQKIATLTTALATNDTDFTAGAAKAEAAARKPGSQSVGSDAWVAAQAALADIDALRADTLGIQVDLERAATDRGEAGAPPYPTLDDARAKAQAQLDAQVARMDAIKAILGEK